MEANRTDIFECILADYESLRGVLDTLSSPEIGVSRKRVIFQRMLPLFRAHIYGAEQSLLLEGLLYRDIRPLVLRRLEEHEMAEIAIHRISLAKADEVWEARMRVFSHLLTEHLRETEKCFPFFGRVISEEKIKELGMKYIDTRNKFNLSPIRELPVKPDLAYDQTGKIGYLVAWLLGVPVWILLLVFLIRG